MKKTIFLTASMFFYQELLAIEKRLQEKGFIVQIPVSAQIMKKKNDFDVDHFKVLMTEHADKKRAENFRTNFQYIVDSDCILVINNEKHHIQGYIGPKVLIEIGIAFFFKKEIYIWNPIERNISYEEELRIFGVKFINNDLEKLH